MSKLLLVEDNPALGDLYTKFLAEHNVSWVVSVTEALTAISSSETYDAAIINFWLGTETAIPVLEEFRSRFPIVPVILISGGSESVSPETTRAASAISGHTLFLMKPFTRSELLDAVRSVTESLR